MYPRPKPKGFDPLAYLAGCFDVIEVDTTFYRPARREEAEAWLERTRFNPDFRFTAKLWKRITHERYDYLCTADELKPWAARAREVSGEPAKQPE